MGGVLGDRFDRRLLVITTHAISGGLATVLAVIAFAGQPSELAVIVIAFLLNTSYAVAKPALVSVLPATVPKDELTDAVGVNTLQFVIAQMIGPVVAAVDDRDRGYRLGVRAQCDQLSLPRSRRWHTSGGSALRAAPRGRHGNPASAR